MPERKTILVVDDEPDLLLILKDFLSEKYNVLSANNGEEAYGIVENKTSRPDLVLSDINMPQMDGVTLLKKIRETYPAIGVMMLSGQGDVRTAVEAMRLGAQDYISKPVQVFEEINIRIANYFDKQKIENQLAEFVKLRESLYSQVKILTFVSFDVVDSHGLKLGTDVLLAQYTFIEYHKFLEEIIRHYNGAINGTAGDGVMCSFESAQGAVEMAIEVHHQLKTFNQAKNKLFHPFRLRCGIHTGSAVVNKEGRVDQMFAQVLDVAGHIQKQCPENEIYISKETYDEITLKHEFLPLNTEVDGVATFKYKGNK